MKDDMAKQLMTRIAKGDKTAFAELYRAYEAPLYRFITSKLRDPFEANDVLHDVFMEVWRAAAKFEGRSSLSSTTESRPLGQTGLLIWGPVQARMGGGSRSVVHPSNCGRPIRQRAAFSAYAIGS